LPNFNFIPFRIDAVPVVAIFNDGIFLGGLGGENDGDRLGDSDLLGERVLDIDGLNDLLIETERDGDILLDNDWLNDFDSEGERDIEMLWDNDLLIELLND